jgi:hypothetical protein
MTDNIEDTTYGPAEDFAEQRRARHIASREVVMELMKTSPLEGLSAKEMHEVNARGRVLQDGLRGSVMVGLASNENPAACFNAALEALITVFATMEQTPQTRESIGYLLAIAQGVQIAPDGIMSVANGELYLSAVIDPEEEVSDETRDRLGIPRGSKIKPGGTMRTFTPGRANGENVIDAAELFAKGRTPDTVH